MVGASIFATSGMLDKIWEEAKGHGNIGGLNFYYNVRPNMTKEQWKKQWCKQVFGKQDDYAIGKNGKIIMPNLGII